MTKAKNNLEEGKKYKFSEAKDYLCVSIRCLRYLVLGDNIVYHRTGGVKRGRLFFLQEDLDGHLYPKGNKKLGRGRGRRTAKSQ